MSRRKLSKANQSILMVLGLVFVSGILLGVGGTILVSRLHTPQSKKAASYQIVIGGEGAESSSGQNAEMNEIQAKDKGKEKTKENEAGVTSNVADRKENADVASNVIEKPKDTQGTAEADQVDITFEQKESKEKEEAKPEENPEDDIEAVREQDAKENESASIPDSMPDTEDSIKSMLESGKTVLDALKTLYAEDLVIAHEGTYHFIPINPELKMHNLRAENLKWINDHELQYVKDDKVISHKGIDVSRYQGDIDWEKVKNDGVEFAFVRAGVRGYESGKLVPDDSFYDNAVKASEQGIDIGAYFFSQAITKEEAEEEADLVIESLSGNQIAYPIVFDLEYIRSDSGRMKSLSKDEITGICKAFCKRIKKAGYTPMIYGNIQTFGLLLNMEDIEGIDKWFASYSTELYFPYKFKIWQYTQKGHVDGIDGYVDMNIRVD